MQYLGYLSILYTYIRVPGLIDSTRQTDYLFDQLKNYKQHEALTLYHKACFYALKKNKEFALTHLILSLEKGFGSLYQIKYDRDLDFIRGTEEYVRILKQYFPAESAAGIKSQ